jgi:outer membrane protein assembly factor BamB/tetratricopeptide (TPR) repeat protein
MGVYTMMPDIFCPHCGELILDRAICPSCNWQRPVEGESLGSPAWRADLGTRLIKPHCYPVVAAGLFCLGTEDGALLALKLSSGEVAWERPLGGGQMAHALATDGERLFVGCEDVQPIPSSGKALLALDARTGEELWQCSTLAHSLSSAAVAAGTVYFTASDGLLHAVDAASGQERWAAEHRVWGPAAPTVGEGVVCAGGRGGTLAAYSAADGSKLWDFSAQGWFAAPLAIDAGCVYAICWDDYLYVLDAHTGELMWQYKGERGKGLTSPVAVAEGRVFVGSRVYRQAEGEQSNAYAMVALKAAGSDELWRFYTGRHIFTPPVVAEDVLFFGSNDGLFYAVDAGSGTERWRAQVTSRAVTQPQVTGDVVVFGGRDGMVHAIRWRVEPREELLAPATYKRRGEYLNAAIAHALRDELTKSATVYAEKLDRPREAALLHERAGQMGKAAPLWEGLGELKRARDLYRQAGDKLGLAGVLERMGELLDAARLHEEVGDLEEAARLYEEAGDRAKAAELYDQVGQSEKASDIWRSLGRWEVVIDKLVADDRLAEAAAVLEQQGLLDRAADLYEQAGQLQEALGIEVRLGRWENAADLASHLGDYEQEGMAQEQLKHPLRAAEAYKRAAEQSASDATVDEERVAVLYERAAQLYRNAYREKESTDCRRQVRRYRRLPEVVVQGQARDPFVENEWNVLDLRVQNVGFGVACNIRVVLSENFQTQREEVVPGLPEGDQRSLPVHARPREGEYGARVPLEVVVAYEDIRGNCYQVSQMESVLVVRQGSGILGRETPLEVHIHGDLVEPGAKKVAGHEVQEGGQVGDRVEIHRSGGSGLTMESGETGDRVEIRRNGRAVRRCPDCNLPIEDPEQRYCPDCGAPLGEDRGH